MKRYEAILIVLAVLIAGLALAEQKELTGVLKGKPGGSATIKTEDNKYISLGEYSADGTVIGGKDVSGINLNDPIKVVVEGTVSEKGKFKIKELISIEKLAGDQTQ